MLQYICMNSERLSSINKVAGGTEEQQKIVHETYEQEFLTEKFIEKGEREKTPEEKEIIAALVMELNDFLGKYGAKPLNLEETHIHILDKSKMSQEELENFEKTYPDSFGFYQAEEQGVVISGWDVLNHLELANMIVHELIHFLSYGSAIIDKATLEESKNLKINIHIHRTGLSVQKIMGENRVSYFNDINEAVTEELTKRFGERFKKIPLLAEEYENVLKVREKYSNPDILATKIRTIDKPESIVTETMVKGYGYKEHRENLNSLIKEIYEKRKDDFASEEEIFTIFAKAAMTGEVKELATLMDSTLGAGTFKKIARPKEDDDK